MDYNYYQAPLSLQVKPKWEISLRIAPSPLSLYFYFTVALSPSLCSSSLSGFLPCLSRTHAPPSVLEYMNEVLHVLVSSTFLTFVILGCAHFGHAHIIATNLERLCNDKEESLHLTTSEAFASRSQFEEPCLSICA